MSSRPLLRLIQATAALKSRGGKSLKPIKRYNLQVSCRVKPNVSGNREGIFAVGTEKVDMCVAAVPRNGEANAAASRVLAQVFHVPNSNVGVIQGLKSRDKTLCITDLDIGSDTEELFLQKALQRLEEAIMKN